MRNWKTTTSGIVGLLMAALGIATKLLNGEALGGEDMAVLGGLITTAIGLIHAKDATTPTIVEKLVVTPAGPTVVEKIT